MTDVITQVLLYSVVFVDTSSRMCTTPTTFDLVLLTVLEIPRGKGVVFIKCDVLSTYSSPFHTPTNQIVDLKNADKRKDFPVRKSPTTESTITYCIQFVARC